MSKATLLREYPYSVEINAELVGGQNHDRVREFLKGRSTSSWPNTKFKDKKDYLIYRFKFVKDARAFQSTFGGKILQSGENGGSNGQ